MKPSRELRHQAAQLLIMGFDGQELTPRHARLIRHLQPGGTILFARNLATAQQAYALNEALRAQCDLPLFTCVDLEGGTVDRLKNIVAPAPSENEVALSGERKLFRRHGELLGAEARALGFNVDFAPVTDLGFEASRSVLGLRTVSGDPAATIEYVREFLKGLHSQSVLGCGKHYPGLGEASLDSHLEMPSVSKPFDAMWQQDLAPYRALKRDFPFVMVAHCAYPEVTPAGEPASLSRKWMADILRKKIGYPGIILSDDLEMGGVLAAAGIEQAAIETLRAGADMFLVCHQEEFVLAAYEAVLREAERDRRFRRIVEQAVRRVVNFKSKNKAVRRRFTAPPTEAQVEKLRRQVGDLRHAIATAARRA